MKKRMFKSLTAGLLALLMIFTMVPGKPVMADEDVLMQSGCKFGIKGGQTSFTAAAGSTVTVTQKIVMTADYYLSGNFVITTENSNSPLTIDNIVCKSSNYRGGYDEVDVVDLYKGQEILLSYRVKISDYATVGTYGYSIGFECNSFDDPDESGFPVNVGEFNLEVIVNSEKQAPTFKLLTEPYVSAKAGDTVTVAFDLQNVGSLDAYETYVSFDAMSDLIPVGTTWKQKVGRVSAGESCHLSYKFKVDSEMATKVITMPIVVSCKTLAGVAAGNDGDYAIYLSVEGTEKKESTLIVSKVTHKPEIPAAGEELSVTFKLENTGDEELKNVKVYVPQSNLGTFDPVSSDPYFYVGTIGARKSKEVTIKVKCNENIIEGTNTLDLSFAFDGAQGTSTSGTTVYILNVIGKEEETVSKPKLMVTDFSTDVDAVMSGKSFNFKFLVKNTNDETRAKNIKVKVTSNEFSVSSGSNSFFISEIKPGESHELTINLKASAAAATGAYPITVSMEYEYDGMPTGKEYDASITASDELLLQINETLRASLENIQIGDWNPPMLGSATAATFEFYNMGKSVLNNVYVTVEGDFVLATGDSYYMGNMQPGYPEFVECSVIPLVEGDAVCKFIIHMEDSNGDEVTSEHSTTVYVGNGENMWNDNPGGNMDYPGIDFPEGEIIGFDEFGNPIFANGGETDEKAGFLSFLGKFKWPVIIGGSIVIAAGVAVAVVFFVRSKKKKADADFDE